MIIIAILISLALILSIGYLLYKPMLKWYREQPHEFGMFYKWKFYKFPELDVLVDDLKAGKITSEYYGAHYWGVYNYDATRYFPTIDDPVMRKVYNILSNHMGGMDAEERAEFLLTFVQQNIRYVKDQDATGKSDYWKFPINTFVDREGDCEDMAFLLVCLYNRACLDSLSIWITRHMTVGVYTGNTAKHTFTYKEGKVYVQAEPTSMGELGTASPEYHRVYSMEPPIEPNENFKAKITKEVD